MVTCIFGRGLCCSTCWEGVESGKSGQIKNRHASSFRTRQGEITLGRSGAVSPMSVRYSIKTPFCRRGGGRDEEENEVAGQIVKRGISHNEAD